MAISRKGLRRIVVGGDEFYWRAVDDIDYQVSIVTADGLERGQHGRWIRFAIPYQPDLREPAWWEDHRVTMTPRLIQRAIEIARRRDLTTDIVLTAAEMRETIGIELLRVEDELQALTHTLHTGTRADLVPRVLAVGCREAPPALVDDWTVCHSELLVQRRFELQSSADAWYPDMRAMRSAIGFLVGWCKRVGIDLAIDTTIVDDRIRAMQPLAEAPWGIPASHDWWTGL